MRRITHRLVVAATTGALVTGLLTAAIQPSAVASGTQATPVARAAQATLDARRVRFVASMSIGETRVRSTGRADMGLGRTAVDVAVGTARTEVRRIGSDYYVDARRLGSRGRQWVHLDGADDVRQMSLRSVRSLVAGLSPQRLLQAVAATTSATRVGTDSQGTHYRVRGSQCSAAFLPLADAFGTLPSCTATGTPIDAWVDARGHVSKVTVATAGFTVAMALRQVGVAIEVAVPLARTSGDRRSASGTFLFGRGMAFPRTTTRPVVTVTPTVEISDGIIRGNLHATSSPKHTLAFEVISGSKGGKLTMGTVEDTEPTTMAQSFTVLPYADWLGSGAAKGRETFRVRARQVTPANRYLAGVPLIGRVAAPVIDLLQGLPTVGPRLSPVIGTTTVASIPVRVGDLAPGQTPVAFTTKVPGYRGDLISINFFPASGLAAGEASYLVLQGSALGARGNTNPYQRFDGAGYSVGTAVLRSADEQVRNNVITWDSRGTYDSGGVLQLDNPFFEGRDVSEIISWAAANTPVILNGVGDPAVGMVGGSSGGSIQLVAAGIDPRVDAIVPSTTWNSLIGSLQPSGVLNASAARNLLAAISGPDVRSSPRLRAALAASISAGRLTADALDLLAASEVSTVLGQLSAPTLLVQSTSDPLFPVTESVATAQRITSNPYGVPVKTFWLDAQSTSAEAAQAMATATMRWLAVYVHGTPLPIDLLVPKFQWWDQALQANQSSMSLLDDGLLSTSPIMATTAGGRLAIPSAGSPSTSSLRIRIPVPAGAHIVGSPSLTFAYQGTGRSAALRVTVSDPRADAALKPTTSLLPLVLDGKSHTASFALSGMVFTAQDATSLRVTVEGMGTTASATGGVTFSALTVVLPRVAPT